MGSAMQSVVMGGGGDSDGVNLTVTGESFGAINITAVAFDADSGYTSLGANAFDGWSALEALTIASGVTSTGNYACRNCAALTVVNFPAGFTTLGAYTFWGCNSLTSITLPSSLTSIGAGAFYNCTALAVLTCNATTPPTLGSLAFNAVPATCSIKVPAASVAAYQAASGWSARAAYITAI